MAAGNCSATARRMSVDELRAPLPRSKESRAARVAEKILREAIAAETIELQAELSAERRENERLRGVLAQVVRLAQTEAAPAPQMPAQVVELPPDLLRQLELKPEPSPPDPPLVELSDDDNLGPGRWA